jgi:hypothetical protein
MSGSAWIDVATWLGTLASIVGAAVAVWQAKVAKKEADRATQLQATIIGRAMHVDLTEVDTSVTKAVTAMAKYGPRGNAAGLVGYEPGRDAGTVQEVIEVLDRHQAALLVEIGPDCGTLRNALVQKLGQFSAQADEAGHLARGRQIYLELTSFSGNVQTALRNKLLAAS